jgi:signal peptidase I
VLAWLLLVSVGASLVMVQVERFATKAYAIPSSAMEPTLHCARPASGCRGDTVDRVLVARLHLAWAPSRGEIIVFETPPRARERCGVGGTFAKRLIGLPGESVSVRNGHLFVDGKLLHEPYVEPSQDADTAGTWHVPEGEYFFLGDNRAQSCDSRAFGPVARESFVGPVVARYWPFSRFGLL